MTLLITVFAALISTVFWYGKDSENTMKTGTLSLIYWGAAIMWFVDAIFEYMELKAEYFVPSPQDMVNDAFLGFSVVAFGLVIWLVMLLLNDPKGVLRKTPVK